MHACSEYLTTYSHHLEDAQHLAHVGMNVARIDAVVAGLHQPHATVRNAIQGVNNALRYKLPRVLNDPQSFPIMRSSMFANRRCAYR